jgi:hypothetical protein
VKLSALILSVMLLSGCAVKNGRWYPIVGFGWVVVNTNQPTVVTTKALGFNAGNGQVCIGLSSLSTVKVPTNANVIIELK